MDLFIQGEGVRGTELVVLRDEATVGELLRAAHMVGVPEGMGAIFLFVEGNDAAEHDTSEGQGRLLSGLGIGHRRCVHLHRKRRIEVTVHYGMHTASHPFAPVTTVGRVLAWAVEKFRLDPAQAAEHALQLCGSEVVPDADAHIGALVHSGDAGHGTPAKGQQGGQECHRGEGHHAAAVCFNLIVKHRPQG